jgi:hypothetical protein
VSTYGYGTARLLYVCAAVAVAVTVAVRLVTQRAAAGQRAEGRGHLTTIERGRNGTVQLRQEGGVGRRGLVDSDGALLLKATSTMEGEGEGA